MLGYLFGQQFGQFGLLLFRNIIFVSMLGIVFASTVQQIFVAGILEALIPNMLEVT